jgi:BioD-like phosphotransacetylase family protein
MELPESGLIDGRGKPYKALKDVKNELTKIAQDHDLVIVEISSKIPQEEQVKIAEFFEAKVLAVIRHKHALKTKNIKQHLVSFGQNLSGVLINARTKYTSHEVQASFIPELEALNIKVFGTIPEDIKLLSATVDQVVKHLNGKYVLKINERSSELIENFLVGGWTMDDGSLYFSTKDNKAVITRGDRPDLQMSALNTKTACLIMTKGINPIEYVEYEAQEEGVSIVVVDKDTLNTMESLDSLIDVAKFDHKLKLERLHELIQSEVDSNSLLDAIGVAS